MNSWDDVRFFLEVARCGNVSGAAKALGVNHSTVSRRIQSFETKHGVRLFERVSSGYELTESGIEIYELALEIEANNHNLSRRLQGRDNRITGKIRITMPHDIFDFLLAEYIAEFLDLYPEIEIEMQVAKGVKNLFAREADIAVRLSPAPPEYLIGKEICKLVHGIYYNRQLHKADRSPIITWSDEENIPDWAEQNLANPYVVMQVDDLSSMYAAVKNSVGYARMPCHFHNLISDSEVIIKPAEMPKSTWGIWVLSHIDLKNTLRVKTCREFLVSTIEQNKDIFSKLDFKAHSK